jgi:hypothetical protein
MNDEIVLVSSTWDAAIPAMETAQKNHIQLVPDGDEVEIDISRCADADQAALIMDILRHNKVPIVALTSNQIRMKGMISEMRSHLVEADNYVHNNLDWFLRSETVYRMLWPNDTECIGEGAKEGQCGPGLSEIVRCAVCEAKADSQ